MMIIIRVSMSESTWLLWFRTGVLTLIVSAKVGLTKYNYDVVFASDSPLGVPQGSIF